MTEKEQVELRDKVEVIDRYTKKIEFYNEEICNMTEELEMLETLDCSHTTYIEIEGYNKQFQRVNNRICLDSGYTEEIMEFIKEMLRRRIQKYENLISEKYEKIISLLK